MSMMTPVRITKAIQPTTTHIPIGIIIDLLAM
jgi:hypothetical protein